MDIITKQKRVSDAASQQLLLDTHIIKTILLQLPVFGLESDGDTNINQGLYYFTFAMSVMLENLWIRKFIYLFVNLV